MIPYILHVTAIITACFLFYKALLQKATFFQLNRYTLSACIVVSFLLPLVPAPPQWSWRTRVCVPSPQTSKALLSATHAPVSGSANSSIIRTPTYSLAGSTTTLAISGFTHMPTDLPATDSSTGSQTQSIAGSQTQSIAGSQTRSPTGSPITPSIHASTIGSQSQSIAGSQVSPLAGSQAHPFTGLSPLLPKLWRGGYWLYWFGVIAFGANLLLQIVVLLYQSYSRPIVQDGPYRIVETSGDRAPCSFGYNIFINPALYDSDTYNQILLHEKIHASGGHTFDILLAEILVMWQWFNPFAWLYRKEVENNLEFLTDASLLRTHEVERSAYQLSLLRVAAPHLLLAYHLEIFLFAAPADRPRVRTQ